MKNGRTASGFKKSFRNSNWRQHPQLICLQHRKKKITGFNKYAFICIILLRKRVDFSRITHVLKAKRMLSWVKHAMIRASRTELLLLTLPSLHSRQANETLSPLFFPVFAKDLLPFQRNPWCFSICLIQWSHTNGWCLTSDCIPNS